MPIASSSGGSGSGAGSPGLPRKSTEEELAECKGSLAELVDEVMYLEGALEAEKSKTELMQTLFSELVGLDVGAVDALEDYATVLERGGSAADLRARKNDVLARRATFFDGVRARLRDKNMSFPASVNVSSFDPSAASSREQQLRSKVIELERECAKLRVGSAPLASERRDDAANAIHVSRSGSITVDSRREDEVSALKRELEHQRQRFESEKTAILERADAEIRSVEAQIEAIQHSAASVPETPYTAQAARSVRGMSPVTSSSRAQVVDGGHSVRVHRSGSVDVRRGAPGALIVQSEETFVSGGISEQERLSLLRRIGELEEEVAALRAQKSTDARSMAAAKASEESAIEELRALEQRCGFNAEELTTERTQTDALRRELDKASRAREMATREQRAAESRYEALATEMKTVMEERDEAQRAKRCRRRGCFSSQAGSRDCRHRAEASACFARRCAQRKERRGAGAQRTAGRARRGEAAQGVSAEKLPGPRKAARDSDC